MDNIRIGLKIQTYYKSEHVDYITETDGSKTIASGGQIYEITTFVLDNIVSPPPTCPNAIADKCRARHEWARALLLQFVAYRCAEHYMTITASSMPEIVGETFEIDIDEIHTAPGPLEYAVGAEAPF